MQEILHQYLDAGEEQSMHLMQMMYRIHEHADLINSTIIYDCDYAFDYFRFKTPRNHTCTVHIEKLQMSSIDEHAGSHRNS